jgi:predicted MPP superfamily phosphohydrolase
MWLVLVKVLAAVTIYGTAIEPRFVVRNDEPAAIPNLPAAWEGKRVAVFADLQVGMWWSNRDAARRLVRRVVALKPAFVLIVGDFVYDADDSVDSQMLEVLGILQPILDAHIPTYAVLGNHDYSLMNEGSKKESYVAVHVHRALDSAGVHMMDNRVEPLYAPGTDSMTSRPLYLVGIGERWAKNDHDTSTFAAVPAGVPRLAFMHDPDSFADIPAGAAPVAIAAHTHGMQLGIPWLTDYLWRHEYSDKGSGVEGWVDHYGQPGNHVYINRGVGFSIVPARVNAVPELTVFTLKAAKDTVAGVLRDP